MNDINYGIALGYPLGILNLDGEKKLYIENKQNIISLSKYDVIAWYTFLGGCDISSVINKLKELGIEYVDDYKELLDKSFIIAIDINDLKQSLSIISDYILRRYGIGIGEENNSHYILIGDEKISVSIVEYNIWIKSEGVRNIKEIVEIFSKDCNISFDESTELILNGIISLTKKGLLFWEGDITV